MSALLLVACSHGDTSNAQPKVDATTEISPTTTTTAAETTTTPADPSTTIGPAPTTPPTPPEFAPAPTTAFPGLVAQAAAAGVPLASSAIVVASSCFGDQGRSHWGYYNNGALGGAITERDGAVVPLDAICLNPNQPDSYSSLLHELGHRYMWHRGVWESASVEMGSLEHATECFAKAYGATTFGQGGCSSSDAAHLMAWLGL